MKFFWISIILISYLIRSFKHIFFTLYLLQLKEYRFDRLIAHLKTTQGKKWIFSTFSLLKWAIIFVYFYVLYLDIFNTKGIITSLINKYLGNLIFIMTIGLPFYIYAIEGVKSIYDLLKTGWKFPKITFKSAFIALLTGLFILILFMTDIYTANRYIKSDWPYFYFLLLIGDKLITPLIISLSLILNIPKQIYTVTLIQKAKNKLLNLKIFTVIGITGSVGKTSTKEFLAQILNQKYISDKTPASTNTLIGIAYFIIEKLNPKSEVFVVEMGAYKKGEIKEICHMVHPKIGIITAIGKQHIDLFGSQENIVSAKFELISSLPRDGVAIFNGDNSFCLDMAQKAKQMGLKTLIYGTAMQRKFDITATDIKVLPEKLEFNIHIKSQNIKGETRLIGIQNIPNILAAVSTAHLLGVKMDDIEKSLEKLTPADKTMNLVGKTKGVNLIDDTFNASPESLQAALDYMKIYKGKKILVLTPLIELGGFAPEIHRKFGEEAARICDIVFLTNQNYIKDFMKGAERADRGREKVKLASPHSITELVKDKSEINAVAIFEGKEAAKFLSQLI